MTLISPDKEINHKVIILGLTCDLWPLKQGMNFEPRDEFWKKG